MKIRHIHFIGICGVAMSALALAFKKMGWEVTGSDVGFYPPVSTHLKEAKIDFYPGWHPQKMIETGTPDLVMVGNVASSHNPEWLYVQEHKLNYKSYPELIKEYLIKKNSIVCAGTYGKTTSSAIMAWILKEADFDPSYMFGGIACETARPHPALSSVEERVPVSPPPQRGRQEGVSFPAANISNSAWSVVEGDEYKASRWDNGPKFAYYSPTHLLLTSVVWDHADVYPTPEKYLKAFNKLVESVPKNGLIVLSEKAQHVILSEKKYQDQLLQVSSPQKRGSRRHSLFQLDSAGVYPRESGGGNDTMVNKPFDDNTRERVVTYGKTAGNDYVYNNVKQTKDGVQFDIFYQDKTFHLTTTCLGDYFADNITGCFAMAHQIGITPKKIIEAVAKFPGIKRRLEKRYCNGVTIFDDIAHSPTKAQATLNSLKQIYQKNIYTVFEPNAGNRESAAAPGYAHAFVTATEVIIPRLTAIKHDPTKPAPITGEGLTKIILETHPNAKYIDNDEKLVSYLRKKIQPGDVVVFLGSHGFRGMIEGLINKYDANLQI